MNCAPLLMVAQCMVLLCFTFLPELDSRGFPWSVGSTHDAAFDALFLFNPTFAPQLAAQIVSGQFCTLLVTALGQILRLEATILRWVCQSLKQGEGVGKGGIHKQEG